jgi:hypothetical protein
MFEGSEGRRVAWKDAKDAPYGLYTFNSHQTSSAMNLQWRDN